MNLRSYLDIKIFHIYWRGDLLIIGRLRTPVLKAFSYGIRHILYENTTCTGVSNLPIINSRPWPCYGFPNLITSLFYLLYLWRPLQLLLLSDASILRMDRSIKYTAYSGCSLSWCGHNKGVRIFNYIFFQIQWFSESGVTDFVNFSLLTPRIFLR